MTGSRGPRVEFYDDTRGTNEPVYRSSSGHRVTVEEPDEDHPARSENGDGTGRADRSRPDLSEDYDKFGMMREGAISTFQRFLEGSFDGGMGSGMLDTFSAMDRMMTNMERDMMRNWDSPHRWSLGDGRYEMERWNHSEPANNTQSFYSSTTTRLGPDGQMFSETRETVRDARTGHSTTRVVTRRGTAGNMEEVENVYEDGQPRSLRSESPPRITAEPTATGNTETRRGWWPFRRQ
uniref:Uncharacterized protein n=1 Tax=Compsopogon caeruleus TaxID=31354 RepID=A0A7S1TBH3_9RHOD|mmetsp:Transcript_16209/g.32862  ORF Transcript_16209/g.32862 Transcript_16209/m.32862 type:complete len:236 (+) Transcript_16209:81-788(+)